MVELASITAWDNKECKIIVLDEFLQALDGTANVLGAYRMAFLELGASVRGGIEGDEGDDDATLISHINHVLG